MMFFGFHQCIRRRLRAMDSSPDSIGFHATGRIDSIAKELKASLFSPKNTGCDFSTVQAHSKGKVGCIISQGLGQITDQLFHAHHAFSGEFGDANGMVWLRFGQSSYCQVTISNGLYSKKEKK
jgi:hypothetical protein